MGERISSAVNGKRNALGGRECQQAQTQGAGIKEMCSLKNCRWTQVLRCRNVVACGIAASQDSLLIIIYWAICNSCFRFSCYRDCRVVRDPQTLKSKGYGFVSFVKKSVSTNFKMWFESANTIIRTRSFLFFFFNSTERYNGKFWLPYMRLPSLRIPDKMKWHKISHFK